MSNCTTEVCEAGCWCEGREMFNTMRLRIVQLRNRDGANFTICWNGQLRAYSRSCHLVCIVYGCIWIIISVYIQKTAWNILERVLKILWRQFRKVWKQYMFLNVDMSHWLRKKACYIPTHMNKLRLWDHMRCSLTSVFNIQGNVTLRTQPHKGSKFIKNDTHLCGFDTQKSKYENLENHCRHRSDEVFWPPICMGTADLTPRRSNVCSRRGCRRPSRPLWGTIAGGCPRKKTCDEKRLLLYRRDALRCGTVAFRKEARRRQTVSVSARNRVGPHTASLLVRPHAWSCSKSSEVVQKTRKL